MLDKLVFVCLLALIVLTPIPYGTVHEWWEALFELAVFAVTGAWIIEGLLTGSWHCRRLLILLPLILITAFAFAQTVELPGWVILGAGPFGPRHTLTIDRYQTYLTARKTLALTLFTVLLLLHTSTPKRLRWLVRAVIAVGLASALFGLLRQYWQSSESISGFGLPYLFYGIGYGEFISPSVFAYLMEMVYGVVAGLSLGGGIRRDRVPLYIAIALCVWTALVLSNSRGGIVGFACQSIFLLFVSLTWYSERRFSRGDGTQTRLLSGATLVARTLFVVLIVATLIVGVFWMGGESLSFKLSSRASTSTQAVSDGTSRKEIWRASWQIIKHDPWTGIGFGAFFLASPKYVTGPGLVRVEEAHNDYLDLATNGGVITVGLAGWFLAMVIWRARSTLQSSDPYRRAACLGAMASILSVAVHSLVDFGLQITGMGVIFGSLIVIAVADRRVEATRSARRNV